MMKKFILLLPVLFLMMPSQAQNNPPVAVNDTAGCRMGEFVTVPVTLNDYDPDGDKVRIKVAYDSYAHTDSTITYFLDVNLYGGYSGWMEFKYVIEDENGLAGYESSGFVHIDVANSLTDFLDVNNIRAKFYAYGNHFFDHHQGNFFEYPAGSGLHTMFCSALWLGGYDQQNGLRVAAERYRQLGSDFWTGPLSTDGNAWIDTATSLLWSNIWKLDKETVEYHKLHWNDPGYEMPGDIATWPAHGDLLLGQSYYLAPFIDTNGDSIYSPGLGDYPLIRGDQSLFFIFNDKKVHDESQGVPIGIEIHGMAYGFDAEEGTELDNAVFLSYKIFNRSETTLSDAYLGVFSDFDIGYAWDDFVGCDVARGAYYGYNGDEEDEDYGFYPPAQGIIVLGGPYMDPDGLDNPAGGCDESINGVGFGDGEPDNERYGMRKFVYSNNSGGATGDPAEPEEYYNYMKAIWRDDTAMIYGGNGHPSLGAYGPACDFMFPGLSDPCNWGTGGILPNGPVNWTEETAANNPNDRRGLCAMGPFTLEAGGFQKADIAFITARGDSLVNSVELLKTYIDNIKTFYYQDPDHFGYAYLSVEENPAEAELRIFPNPVGGILNFSSNLELEGCPFAISDLAGKSIISGRIGKNHGISCETLKAGLYIFTVFTTKGTVSAKFIR